MKRHRVLFVFLETFLIGAIAHAQVPAAAGQDPGGAQRGGGRGGRSGDLVGEIKIITPPVDGVPAGQTAWWTDTALMTRLGLTEVQQARIENAFQTHRQSLNQAKATLEKEEAQLSRLLAADSIDRPAVQGQINKVIQARGEMERVNTTMTLEMREQLTRAQWTQLQAQPNTTRAARAAAVRGAGTELSIAARFSAADPVTLEGMVTEFRLQEPRSYVVIAVIKDGKTTSWTGEMEGLEVLTHQQGWTRTSLKVGERVVIEGAHSRNPSENLVNVRSIRKIP